MHDSRSVVPVELEDTDQWLFGTAEDTQALMQMPAPGAFMGEPGPVAVRTPAKKRREEA
jgi:putative SOS response-associated peptidase YedK